MKILMMSLVWLPLAFVSLASSQNIPTQEYPVAVSKVVDGLENPWGMAFLPDGRMLVTERSGNMRLVQSGKLIAAAVTGLPKVTARGQGGLLDVALHPDYARNGWIYWSYNAEENGLHGTELARGKLSGTSDLPKMVEVEVIFRMAPKASTAFHFGSRIVFDRQGYLYLTLGDRGDSPAKGDQQRAQLLADHGGKVVRLLDNGKVPEDNPFVKTSGARAEIFTFGHRNVQGAAMNPLTGKIWAHEHGPQGGDEVNILSAGANYGWPVITYGANYGTGTKIGEGTAKTGMMQPVIYWVPSIAPSGMTFYSGMQFPKWRNNIFVGALAGKLIVRIVLDGDRVVSQERLFTNTFGRIRDIREAPDGSIYFLTDDANGTIWRIQPQFLN